MPEVSELCEWIISSLSTLLQYPVTQDVAQCILKIESSRDLEDFLKTLLDLSKPNHVKFMKELMSKKQTYQSSKGYKKTELDDYIQSKSQDKKKKGGKGKSDQAKKDDEVGSTDKKKTKYVNLYSKDKHVELLKGRHMCECEASKHDLVNNCLSCGRIVCEQEGPGPCLFCNNMVYSKNEGASLGKHAVSESAMALKERLLEFDKSSAQRTKVIDDQSDYFTTDSVWLSKKQRDQLQKLQDELQSIKHSRSHNPSLLLDFTGRCVVRDNTENISKVENSMIDEVAQLLNNSDVLGGLHDVDPNSTSEVQPEYSYTEDSQCWGSKWHNKVGLVQDKHVMEMTDSGVCLSMHQPWATLLVAGIKRHEGRSWYSPHRGRLWIASAAKVPSKEDVDEVCNMYRAMRGDDLRLPKKFPTGCLLGCVTVVDCLTQEEYREKFPDGESNELFIFICEDPIICPVLFPIRGQHKIYKLESKIHQAAVKCIQKLSSIK